MKFSHIMLALVALTLAITMLLGSQEHNRVSRLESAVRIMASPDYENLNHFTEQIRMKALELYNEIAGMRSAGDESDELKNLQLSDEQLRVRMTEVNHRFRQAVASTGKTELLQTYYQEIWLLSQELCDIGNKLSDYKKQHPK